MKPILCIFFSLLGFNCLADNSISGNIYPAPGATEVYTINWDVWDQTHEELANVSWQIAGGNVTASDKHTVTIQWNTTQNNLDIQGSISVSEDLTGEQGALPVTVLDNTPGTSQICNGILGTPKVAVDFGSGTNPGPPISSGSTTYTYEPFCPIDVDQYTILNSEPACRSGWWNVPSDHTGNPNGYMMMVNGSATVGEFYRTTVTGLNPGFVYEFSVWVGNLFDNNSGADPLVRFNIYDIYGNELASSGNIDVPPTNPFAWQQIGYQVYLPPGVTQVQIVMVDESSAGFGNDLVLDDISFAPCFPPVAMEASFSASSEVLKSNVCSNGSVNLYGSYITNSVPFNNPSYQWERSTDGGNTFNAIPGATSLTASYTENSPGSYQYRLHAWETANPQDQVYSNAVYFFVMQMVVNSSHFDITSCSGGTYTEDWDPGVQFNYTDPNGPPLNLTFNWQPINGTPSGALSSTGTAGTFWNATVPAGPDNAATEPESDWIYTLTATNTEYGCSASGNESVAIHFPRRVYVPNAFTPGQPTNYLWWPINIQDQPGSTVQVHDRYGVLVFSSSGPTQAAYSWDGTFNGTPQPTGTFVWQMTLSVCPTKSNTAQGNGYLDGTLELIR